MRRSLTSNGRRERRQQQPPQAPLHVRVAQALGRELRVPVLAEAEAAFVRVIGLQVDRNARELRERRRRGSVELKCGEAVDGFDLFVLSS